MTIELTQEQEEAVKIKAAACGLSTDAYLRALVCQSLVPEATNKANRPLESGRGMWAHYNIDLTGEDIDENRRDMLKNSIFDPEVL